MKHDAQEARFLRKKQAQQGVDEEQQDEQRQFGQNLQQALQAYGKKEKKKDIESQVEYFGHMIEPFNMRDQEQMGQIDQDGFFVFKRKNQYTDAWLDSMEEGNDLMVADKVKKRIKTEGTGYKGIYEQIQENNHKRRDKIIEQQDQDKQEDNQEDQDKQESQNKQPERQIQSQQQQTTLQPLQIKMLIYELLPQNKSANAYIKQLKKNIKKGENKQIHDKILELCNLYIQKTNEYDILTSKREQLQIQIGSGDQQKSEGLNWDDDEQEQKDKQQIQTQKQKQKWKSQKLRSNPVDNKTVENNPGIQNVKRVSFQIQGNQNGKSNKNINKMTQGNQQEKSYSDDDIF